MVMIKLRSDLNKLTQHIKQGGIICTLTDTLYALSCDATNDIAVKKIYDLKGRDLQKSLPIFLNGIEHAKEFGIFTPKALQLAQKFWPGPLTIVVPKKKDSQLSKLIATENVAIRIPNSKHVIDLIDVLKVPLVGTSANRSGFKNITSPKDLEQQINSDTKINEEIWWYKNTNKKNITRGGEILHLHSTIIQILNDDIIILLREGVIPKELLYHVPF